MRKLFTSLLFLLSINAFAQTDSVVLGPGATNMVFYSLANGVQGTAPNNDWHIAFAARYIAGYTYASTSRAAAVIINEAYGLKLFRSPNQKLAQWASFDTTGWQGWQQMHNPDTTWTIGAFNINRNVNDQFNYGWGEYNIGDHNIYSDSSIYLIQLPDGSFKKFAMLTLVLDTAFNIQYSNLNGSAFTLLNVPKGPYSSKNFVYLNLSTNALLDKEPPLTNWDFVALRYNNTTYDSANLTQDMGILTKDADNVYAASGAGAQQACYTGNAYSNNINIIGKSWMGTPADTVIPGLAYFIQQGGSYSYKLTLTGFGGAATGTINFTLGNCSQAQGIEQLNGTINAAVYPVPAADKINVQLNSITETTATISLLDVTGRVILTQSSNMVIGENNVQLNTSLLEAGNYIISVSCAGNILNKLVAIMH